jgi:hypothetical protein
VQFDHTTLPWGVEAFIDSLSEAHRNVVLFKDYFATITGSGRTGSCQRFDSLRASWLGAFAYSDVPPIWQPLYVEYIRLLDGTVAVSMPLHDLCIAGGGTIDDETTQRILSYVDAAQLHLFEMEQEARALRESAP